MSLDFAHALKELYLIVLAYGILLFCSFEHFLTPMSPYRDRKWLQDKGRPTDSSEFISYMESTYFEILGATVARARLVFYHSDILVQTSFCHKSRWPPRFCPLGRLISDAGGECFAPLNQQIGKNRLQIRNIRTLKYRGQPGLLCSMCFFM